MRYNTPWGTSERVRFLSTFGDVVRVASASHGGDGVRLHVQMPATLAQLGTVIGDWRWFEEDQLWAAVALSFPDLYTADQAEEAKGVLRDWYPEAYEAHFNVALQPAESKLLDQRAWERATADKYCVTASFGPGFWNVPDGYVYACGFRALDEAAAGFLVPADKYVNPMRLVLDDFPYWEPDRTQPYIKEAAGATA